MAAARLAAQVMRHRAMDSRVCTHTCAYAHTPTHQRAPTRMCMHINKHTDTHIRAHAPMGSKMGTMIPSSQRACGAYAVSSCELLASSSRCLDPAHTCVHAGKEAGRQQ